MKTGRRIYFFLFFLFFFLFPGTNWTRAAEEKSLPVFLDIKEANREKQEGLNRNYGASEFNRCFVCPQYDLANPFAMAACLAETEACLKNEEINAPSCGAGLTASAGRCVSVTDGCRERYGEHSYESEQTDNNFAVCECAAGYAWNEGRTKCVAAGCPEGLIYYSNYKEENGEFLFGRCQTPDQACQSEYGENSQFFRLDAVGEYYCGCSAGWDWDEAGKSCARQIVVKGITSEEFGAAVSGNVSDRVAGRILLQVESAGEAWYVHPAKKTRHYLGRPADAFSVMREQGLGVSNKDWNSFKGLAPERLKGRILLLVESKGEAYYVNPLDRKFYYLGRPADAFSLMRGFGLGITNNDLASIEGAAGAPFVPTDDLLGVVSYVQGSIIPANSLTSIKDIKKDGQWFRVILKLSSGRDLSFYLRPAGDSYEPAVMELSEIEENIADGGVEKTEVELFVMSHCPYGLQMEKAILPVLRALGSRVNFFLKFTDYAMHGLTELEEQKREFCVNDQGQEKILSYLECFTLSGQSDECLATAGINQSVLGECIAAAEANYKITEKYYDQSTWRSGRYPLFPIYETDAANYGVTGSPTLFINGEKASVQRSPAALLSAICASFKNPPAACSSELSPTVAAPGFGTGEGAGSGSCGG